MQFSSICRGPVPAPAGRRPGSGLWRRRGRRRFAARLVVAAATLGMMVPVERLDGSDRPGPLVVPTALPAVDVCLADGHVLTGRVVDDTGRAEPGVSVTVLQAGRVVASEVTGRNGGFSIAALRGGVYQLLAARAHCVVRLWEPETAPPVAVERLMLVDSVETVRGQRAPGPLGRGYERLKCWLADPLVVAGIVATAVAVPIVVHNANADKDSGS